MRFFLTVGFLVVVFVLCVRSCGSKLLGGDKKSLVPDVGAVMPETPAPSPVSGRSSRLEPAEKGKDAPQPIRSEVYVFKRRIVPAETQFASLASNGNGLPVSVVVDSAANAVLVRGPAGAVKSLMSAIESLDLEAHEAYLDAWMLFVRGERIRDFEASLEWGLKSFLGSSASVDATGFGVAVPAGAVGLSLRAMASNGLVEVVDRPQLRFSSGHASEVSTGEEIPIPLTTFRDGISTTAIEFQRVGLLFQVTPLFLGGNRVRLDVRAGNGLLGAIRKVGDVEIPTISRQTVKSAATLHYDDAMVIGGLETSRREKRFSLLGKSETVQQGRLYVVLMLRSGVPKAVPVIGPGPGLGIEVPGVLGDPGNFADPILLPPLNWPDGIRPKGSPLSIRRHK